MHTTTTTTTTTTTITTTTTTTTTTITTTTTTTTSNTTTAKRMGLRGRGQQSDGSSVTGQGLHLSARKTELRWRNDIFFLKVWSIWDLKTSPKNCFGDKYKLLGGTGQKSSWPRYTTKIIYTKWRDFRRFWLQEPCRSETISAKSDTSIVARGKSGETLEHGADRGEGDIHHERSMHASLDQAKKQFLGQIGTMGRMQGYTTPYWR